MGKSQRTKGHNWEREVARIMREATPGCEAKRGFQTRGGAAEEPDVVHPLYNIECKVGAKPPVRNALVTAVDTCPPGKWAVAVIKEDRKPPYVVMPMDHWLDLVGEHWERSKT